MALLASWCSWPPSSLLSLSILRKGVEDMVDMEGKEDMVDIS